MKRNNRIGVDGGAIDGVGGVDGVDDGAGGGAIERGAGNADEPHALVAGGAGFIGSHLAGALLQAGWRVTCVDNFTLGTRENVAHLLAAAPRFRLIEADLRDLARVSEIFAEDPVDYVFQLAANSDIRASADDPVIEFGNTCQTTFNLLEAMRSCGVSRLFFASTSAVYGDREAEALAEDAGGLAPVSYYGAAKLASEAFVSAYAQMNGMHALVLRFPNIVGPRLTHGVIYDFVRKLRADPERLEILGDGAQSKPYMHVDDLVDGILRFMDAPVGVTTYNIGVESQTPVTRIADICCEEMGLSGVSYAYTGGRVGWEGDVPTFAYDLSRVRAAGWRARHTSDEAVRMAAREAILGEGL